MWNKLIRRLGLANMQFISSGNMKKHMYRFCFLTLFMADKGDCCNLAHLLDRELRTVWERNHKHCVVCDALSALDGAVGKETTSSDSETVGSVRSEHMRHLLRQQKRANTLSNRA